MIKADLAEDVLRLLIKAGDDLDLKRLINMRSAIPKEPFVRSNLSKISDVGNEMSEFIQKVSLNPRTLRTADLPKSARNLGLQTIDDFIYGSQNAKFRNPSTKAVKKMENNIEAILDTNIDGVAGDPRFYWDLNNLIRKSAPDVNEVMAAYTFAPFSASNAVRENTRNWQRFIENPELFPGRVFPEGGKALGGAWQDAIRILGKESPDVTDLSTSGKVVKIGSFGDNLAFPGSSTRATVDRHAVKNAMGLYTPDIYTPDLGDEATYRVFEKAFQNVAKRRGMAPHEVQSATWDTWRRINQANPEKMLDTNMFHQLEVSPIFSLPVEQRKEALRRLVIESGGRPEFVKRTKI